MAACSTTIRSTIRSGSSATATTSAYAAATNIAALNGFSGTGVTVTPAIVSSPRNDGNNALQVRVTTDLPMFLAELLGFGASLPVKATAFAEIIPAAPGCIIALQPSPDTGITMNGGTNITADNCTVASNNSLTLSGGATLTTKVVDHATTAPSVSGGASIVPPSGTPSVTETKATTKDPLCPTSTTCISAVTTDTDRLTTVSGIKSPTGTSGTPVTFASGAVTTGLPTGCSDSYTLEYVNPHGNLHRPDVLHLSCDHRERLLYREF